MEKSKKKTKKQNTGQKRQNSLRFIQIIPADVVGWRPAPSKKSLP